MVKDIVDPVSDERLARFVVGSHRRSHPLQAENAQEAGANDPDILPQAMLRKYITYAKQTCKPKLQNADYDKIAAVRLRYPPISRWVTYMDLTQVEPVAVRIHRSNKRIHRAG